MAAAPRSPQPAPLTAHRTRARPPIPGRRPRWRDRGRPSRSLGFASGSDVVAIALLVVAVLIAVVTGVLGSAARAVFAVALYRYAAGAGATGPFTERDLEAAVMRKR